MIYGQASLTGAYEELTRTEDGDVLPAIAWIEEAGIEYDEAHLWAVTQMQADYRMHAVSGQEMTEAELMMVLSVDLFMKGLAIGLRLGSESW